MKSSSRSASHTATSWRQRALGAAGSLAVLCVFVAAVYVLHRELRDYRLRDIEQSLSLLSWSQLFAAVALTATSYTLLTGYDWLAVHYIDRSLPYARIALASFVSYVSSYNFGAILGGTTMRYRLYSAFGLSAVEIVKIIAICTLTFVLGFCTLAGAVFVFDPLPLPEIIKLPFPTVFPIGVGLLAFVGLYLATSVLWRRPIAVRGWELLLPPPGFTLMQMAVATADLIAAAGVLYMLLPAGLAPSYPQFLGIFLTAQVAGIASHVPGGLGVVEAVLMVTLGPENRAALMGSMVVYRAIYYFLPLGLAAGLLAGHEGFQRWQTVTRFATLFGRWAPAIVPRVLACTTFAGGTVMLVYGALPRSVARWYWIADFVPLPVVELSHFLGSIAGMGLLLLARGLLERLDAAYHLSVALLTAGIIVSLVRGFNVDEAVILTVMLLALLPSRQYFDRRASLLHETFTPGWITSIVLVLLGTVWLGIFSHKHVEYSHSLWWQFALEHDAPRALRATVGAAAVLLVVGVCALAPSSRSADTLARRRRVNGRGAHRRGISAYHGLPIPIGRQVAAVQRSAIRTADVFDRGGKLGFAGRSHWSAGRSDGTGLAVQRVVRSARRLAGVLSGFRRVHAAVPGSGLVAVEVGRRGTRPVGGIRCDGEAAPLAATGNAQGRPGRLRLRGRPAGRRRPPDARTRRGIAGMAVDAARSRKRVFPGVLPTAIPTPASARHCAPRAKYRGLCQRVARCRQT